jgi:hypothetical protein
MDGPIEDDPDFLRALDALEQEIESGQACRAYLSRLWQVAESPSPSGSDTGGAPEPTEEWITLDEGDEAD